MKISFLCFEVSSKCNMNCKFCFAEWRDYKEQLSIEKIKYIIDKLISYGLEAINLTGGDPLLRDDIIDICKYCKEKGLMTIISTNGIKLQDDKDILHYIDSINLPLDSCSELIHNEMRPCAVQNHHKLILELIDEINEFYPSVKIKINTMVGKPNINDIVGIGNIINDKIYSWKLGKFLNSGYGKKFEGEFIIDDDSFNKVANECQKLYEVCNVVEDFKIDDLEVFDIFINGLGEVNIHKKDRIENIGEIDNLDKYSLDIENLNKDYLDLVYKKEET
jgi:Molybdenum cofactor biosynthesis enzyme